MKLGLTSVALDQSLHEDIDFLLDSIVGHSELLGW
jgi:hypothetical protein